MNSGNPKSIRHGNPERSPQKGNVQRLPDYRLERPAPTGRNVHGDEIVQPPRKLGDNCNQLVVGSSPIVPANAMLPSSSGLGCLILSQATGVRLSMGVPMLTNVKQWLFDNTAKALSTSRVIIWGIFLNKNCPSNSVVEYVLGKDEVARSSRVSGPTLFNGGCKCVPFSQ